MTEVWPSALGRTVRDPLQDIELLRVQACHILCLRQATIRASHACAIKLWGYFSERVGLMANDCPSAREDRRINSGHWASQH